MSVTTHQQWLDRAIQLAGVFVETGGGPFGAVVVRDGAIIGEAGNRVTVDFDPTAHAEVSAIRHACDTIKSFRLQGCVLYSSCEPCPMCLGAIYWARIDAVYYAATAEQASLAGFDDQFIRDEMNRELPNRKLPMTHLGHEASAEPFRRWIDWAKRTEY